MQPVSSCNLSSHHTINNAFVHLHLRFTPNPIHCRDVQLGLKLLQEVKAGSESKWHTWIQTLPSSFDTLIYWSDAELEELQTGSLPAEQLKAQVCVNKACMLQ